MTKKMMIVLFILLAVLFLLAGIWRWVVWKDTHGNPFNSYSYMTDDDYNKVLKIPFISHYGDYFRDDLGQYETEKIEMEDRARALLLKYPGITYYYVDWEWHPKRAYRMVEAIITDPSYKLGKKKIHVGSTRAEVERAYRKAPDCYWLDGMGDGYIDGYGIYVRFLYDENDVVTQITLTLE